MLLESASALAEIGAGIQLTPQAVKYLFEFGLRNALLKRSIVPGSWNIRDGAHGGVLGVVDVPRMEAEYGAPYMVIHRAILHEVLYTRALELGVVVRVAARVVEYRFDQGEAVLADGEIVRGDLIVVADGINGNGRRALLQDEKGATDARPTGWAAYRLMAAVSSMKEDEELVNLIADNKSQFWVGDGASCMTYLVKDATMLNIVLSHHDDRNTDGYGPEEYRRAVDDLMAPFEERVTKLLAIAKHGNIVNYPVWAIPPLARWTHESGRGVLVGDSAHAMAFWLSMGVSLATEDGVALAEALQLTLAGVDGDGDGDGDDARALSREDKDQRLKLALRAFELARKPRAESIAAASLHAGTVLHLPLGRARDVRDESLKRSSETCVPGDGQPDAEDDRQYHYGIADKEIRDSCYGYDVREGVREVWRRLHQR